MFYLPAQLEWLILSRVSLSDFQDVIKSENQKIWKFRLWVGSSVGTFLLVQRHHITLPIPPLMRLWHLQIVDSDLYPMHIKNTLKFPIIFDDQENAAHKTLQIWFLIRFWGTFMYYVRWFSKISSHHKIIQIQLKN